MTLDWRLYALGSALFAGLTAILAKVGVEKIPSNMATLIRTVVILSFITVLVLWRRQWQSPWQLPLRSLIFLILSGLATGLSWICYYRALQLGPASLVAPVDKLSLAVAILLSVIFLGEHLNVWQWIGSGLIVVGVIFTTLRF